VFDVVNGMPSDVAEQRHQIEGRALRVIGRSHVQRNASRTSHPMPFFASVGCESALCPTKDSQSRIPERLMHLTYMLW
jgi:hypothetical protein